MKKLSLLLMAVVLVFSLAACGNDSQPANNNQQNNQNNQQNQQEEPTAGLKEAASLEIGAGQAEAVTLDVAELQADPENEILAGFDADIQAKVAEWMDALTEGETLNVKAYALDTENYLSVVLVKEVTPNYGTDGEVYSYVYDKITSNIMDLDYAMAWKTVTDDSVIEAVTAYLQEGQKWKSFNIDAFYVDSDEIPVYLVKTTVGQTDAEDWTYIYVMKDNAILGRFFDLFETNAQ